MLISLAKGRACIAAAVIAAPFGLPATPAVAQPCQIDVNQPSNTTCMAIFGQTDLAQSFRPNVDTITGAGIFLTPNGSPGNVTIRLWDGLPNAGGVVLAGGTALGVPDAWVDVSWPAVNVVPGAEYFLVFTADAQGQGMCVAGDTNDPYPDGIVYANQGYEPFVDFDYTFRTCGFQECQIDVIQPNVVSCMARFFQTDLAQSFRPNVDTMNGAGIFLRQDDVNPGFVRIELWDALPNAGGFLLASGSGFGVPGAWVIVSWPDVSVVPGDEYFLVFTADAQGQEMCIAGDTNDPYPDGNVYANPGYQPFPTFDYTFQTCGFQQGCDPETTRIDFGVTRDDFGNPNACTEEPIVITTQYVHTQNIVFGTAVDNFQPPPVGILDDVACTPACRSSGLPEFATPWWCQFRLSLGPNEPGALAGVTSFSAQLCFVDSEPGTILMRGYNNDRTLIATAANTQNDTELLTIVAPPGELIAYVEIGNPDRPAGVSVDCLRYPDPVARTTDCPWDCGDGDGVVGVVDLLRLLGEWGGPGPCDFGGDGVVDVVDLLKLLGNWGPCDVCPVPFFCDIPELPFCDPEQTCVCASTFDGANICIDVNTPCDFLPCPDGDCPPGTTCVINTCCEPDGTICLPDEFICMFNAAVAQQKPVPGQRTITGAVVGDP